MSSCTSVLASLTVLFLVKLCFVGGVLLHVLGRASEYFGWKGILQVLPNFLPPVNGSLNDYHHLLRLLVNSIYRTH